MRGNKLKILLILVVIGLAVYYLPHFFGSHTQDTKQGMAMPVDVAAVIEREVQQWNEFSGRLVAVDQVEVKPRVSGAIDSIHFQEGAVVQKGDLLFIIDPRPYVAEVAKADGEVASAEAQVSLAITESARAKRLLTDKAIPEREYDEKINALKVAEASVKSAHASLEAAKLNLEYSHIKAPVTGRIGRAEITVGNIVDAGSSAPTLTSIVSNNPVYADFDVDEQTFMSYVRAKATGDKDAEKIPVMLALDAGNNILRGGAIQSFDNRLNPQTATIRVRAVFDNSDGALVPGLFARIMLGNSEPTKAILISDKAIGTDQSKKFVLVVGADNKVQYREIKLGGVTEGLRVIKEGLHAGEKIIVNGLQKSKPGMEVKPQEVQMSEAGIQKPEKK